MAEYDENIAIRRMRNAIPQEVSKEYDDDQLLNLIDIIWDFYEQNGMLNIDFENLDSENDGEQMLSELVDYAQRMLKKDKCAKIDHQYVKDLIQAELDYEDDLDAEL